MPRGLGLSVANGSEDLSNVKFQAEASRIRVGYGSTGKQGVQQEGESRKQDEQWKRQSKEDPSQLHQRLLFFGVRWIDEAEKRIKSNRRDFPTLRHN